MSLKDLKILVVEDDPDLLELLSESFRDEGAQVCTATGGKKALETLQDFQADVIVSDMRMPDGDGLFLAKTLREFHLEKVTALKPLFILTGYSDYPESLMHECGVFKILSKPIALSTLFEEVAAAVQVALPAE